MSFNLGEEFAVVTLSFNPAETPPLAAAKKELYLEMYCRPGAGGGWHFLTGRQDAIQAVTQATGFRYYYEAESDQFVHACGIMVLTPQGRISRYLYGVGYPPLDLRLGLVEAADNRIGSKVDQFLLYCYHYDPVAGKYTMLVRNLLRLGGALTILLLGGLIGGLFWRERRRKAAVSRAGPVLQNQSDCASGGKQG